MSLPQFPPPPNTPPLNAFNTPVSGHHAVMPNANQYFYEKRYVSIHSEDRDLTKFPSASQFSIQLPQDYLNVASVRLAQWSFPANYSVFSLNNGNIAMTFTFGGSGGSLYNPVAAGDTDALTVAIYQALAASEGKEYKILIEPGFYNPDQMATELTNKMNEAVSVQILAYFDSKAPQYDDVRSQFLQTGGYTRFKIVYNSVQQNLWFGNSADAFTLTNDLAALWNSAAQGVYCEQRSKLPEEVNWGLPYFLGFGRCPATAEPVPDGGSPRFYYGDVASAGDDGYWLYPSAPGAVVYVVAAPRKINFMGPAYMYLEINGLNCLDETAPYSVSKFTMQTNQTNGTVNSAFAKIAIPTTPISQWFDTESAPYKYFNPPAERIRDLQLKLRYHNGQLVDFGSFSWSILLELNLVRPQMERSMSMRDAYSLAQTQSKLSNVV